MNNYYIAAISFTITGLLCLVFNFWLAIMFGLIATFLIGCFITGDKGFGVRMFSGIILLIYFMIPALGEIPYNKLNESSDIEIVDVVKTKSNIVFVTENGIYESSKINDYTFYNDTSEYKYKEIKRRTFYYLEIHKILKVYNNNQDSIMIKKD